LFLLNFKLGQAEIWSTSQQEYHLPPQKKLEKLTSLVFFMIKFVVVVATGNSAVPVCLIISQRQALQNVL
jgi:hypothetical protein